MANNIKPSRAEEAFRKRKELLNPDYVEEQSEIELLKKDVDKYFNNVINHYNKRLEQLEKDFDEKIAHLQKKFFDNSNHNIEVFTPTEEFLDDKNYTSIIENIISIEEVEWKEKTRYRVNVSLKGSSRIYNIFILEKKYLPTVNSRITFRYNQEFDKLVNCKII